MKKAEITREELAYVAKEMTEYMQLEPPIEVDGSIEELKSEIEEAAELIEEGDEFTERTIKVLKALGVDLPEGIRVKKTQEEIKEDTPVSKPPTPAPVKKEKKNIQKAKVSKPKLQVVKKAQQGQKTRAQVMAEIVKSTRKKPLSCNEMIERMKKVYGGSEKEAVCKVRWYVALLVALGLLSVDDKGKYTYTVTS